MPDLATSVLLARPALWQIVAALVVIGLIALVLRSTGGQKLFTILFKVPELQRKILMTAMFLAIYRVGFYIPLPIVDQTKLAKWQEGLANAPGGRIFGTVAMFGGTN